MTDSLFLMAGFGASSAVAALAAQSLAAHIRSKKLNGIELVPNCLLTRYPLVFIPGTRSLFYGREYWNLIPAFLAEHGYEIEVLALPWRPGRGRMQALRAALQSRARACHLIGDSSIAEELGEVRRWNLDGVASVTVVEAPPGRRPPGHGSRRRTRQPGDLRPAHEAIYSLTMPARVKARHDLDWWLTRAQIFAHNLVGGGYRVNACEVGVPAGAEGWRIERLFLDHAISLAERDAR